MKERKAEDRERKRRRSRFGMLVKGRSTRDVLLSLSLTRGIKVAKRGKKQGKGR